MMKFMHHKNLNNHYILLTFKDDECWIPVEDILKILSTPSTGSTARYYSFDQGELQSIMDSL